MAALKLWVQVLDADGDGPLEAAAVTATITAVADEEGDAQNDIVWISVTKDGYTPYVEQPYVAPDMETPIVIHLEVAPEVPEVLPPEPPEEVTPPPIDVAALPELTTRGHCLQTNTWWTAVQCSDFNLLARFQAGEDITPVLAQRQAAGFNLLRVWTAYDIPGIGTFLDIDYRRVPAFVSLCARYGLYVEFCAYTGINDPTHWPQLCDAARACQPRPLLELVNELDQNSNEPDGEGRVFHLGDYAQPEGLLTSHGSNGSEQWPVTPYWSYCTFHTNDAFEWQRKVGHNAWEIWTGPTLSNETTRYCDKATRPDLAYDAAAGAALLCAGSCFHSVRGKTSVLWDADEELAAMAWAEGARSVELGYQDGIYRHRADLETPDLLRVYQRFFADDRGAWTVEIRK